MHPACREWVARHLIPARCVLDLGGRDVNGTVRDLFPGARYLTVDPIPGPGVDVVADGATVDAGHGQWDVVLCLEVLEHVDDATARGLLVNGWAHLAPGGRMIVTAAGPGRAAHSAITGDLLDPQCPAEFYRGVTVPLLAAWLDGLDGRVTVDVTGEDIRAVIDR